MTSIIMTLKCVLIVFTAFLPLTWPYRYFTLYRSDPSDLFFLVRHPTDMNSIFFSGEDLYDNTVESLQWLVGPTDIRRYNIFSPSSTYQINLRYRNDPSVVRYYGYQLWKVHETNMKHPELNKFWQMFG